MLLIVKSFLLYICLLMHFHGILKLDEFKVSFALKLTLRLYFFLVVVLKRQAWLVAGFPFHLRMVRSSRDLYGWHIYLSNIKISWSNSKVSILFIFCNLIIWYANPSTGKMQGDYRINIVCHSPRRIYLYILYIEPHMLGPCTFDTWKIIDGNQSVLAIRAIWHLLYCLIIILQRYCSRKLVSCFVRNCNID